MVGQPLRCNDWTEVSDIRILSSLIHPDISLTRSPFESHDSSTSLAFGLGLSGAVSVVVRTGFWSLIVPPGDPRGTIKLQLLVCLRGSHSVNKL